MPTRDRIYVAYDDESVFGIYEELTKSNDEFPNKPFRYDREVFLASLVLGYASGCKPKKLNKTKEKFPWPVLINDPSALPIMQAIALHKTKEPSILLDDDAVATIAEEYANAGVHVLKEKLLDCGGDLLLECALDIITND